MPMLCLRWFYSRADIKKKKKKKARLFPAAAVPSYACLVRVSVRVRSSLRELCVQSRMRKSKPNEYGDIEGQRNNHIIAAGS